MAIFPQGKTRVRERCKGGEGKVFEALARHLEDDYIVWHDIPLMGSGRQPDFVLLHPQHGLLILEVKDWKLSTLADANPMLVKLNTPDGICAVEHPVAQARGYALDAVHLLQKKHLAATSRRLLRRAVVLFLGLWCGAQPDHPPRRGR